MSKQTKLPERFPAKGWAEVPKCGNKNPKIGDALVLSDGFVSVFSEGDNLNAPVSFYRNPIYRRITPKRTKGGEYKFTVTVNGAAGIKHAATKLRAALHRFDPNGITFKIGRGK